MEKSASEIALSLDPSATQLFVLSSENSTVRLFLTIAANTISGTSVLPFSSMTALLPGASSSSIDAMSFQLPSPPFMNGRVSLRFSAPPLPEPTDPPELPPEPPLVFFGVIS